MKSWIQKAIALSVLLAGHNQSFLQAITDSLDGNNGRAYITNRGVFFRNLQDDKNGYEWPKDSGNHLIYSSAFWFGAQTTDGSVRVAAERHPIMEDGVEQSDFYPGAIKADGTAEAPVTPFADEVYLVSKLDIEYHVANFTDPGYIMPHGIANWPAHGDVALGLASNLAPFADYNGNGIYEPELGEYPEIRGDHTAYVILNDTGGPHLSTTGDPLGIEIHLMFYQYDGDDFIENTTFINARVINRSSQDYTNFIAANYCDYDIGDSEDDYMGSYPEGDLVFGYNSDLMDTPFGGAPGYGDEIPALGVISLNNPMHVAGTFYPLSGGAFASPLYDMDYWNHMNGRWMHGVPYTYGGYGGTPSDSAVRYILDGDPRDGEGWENWTEVSVGNPGGDRRFFSATEPQDFNAGEVLCFDYAVVVANIGTPIENAGYLIDNASEVKAFYYDQPHNYCDFTLGVSEEIEEMANKVLVYPSPNSGNFSVAIDGSYDIEIYALDGRLVFQQENLSQTAIVQSGLSVGTYVAAIYQGATKQQVKISVE